jgi:hypothetical protein
MFFYIICLVGLAIAQISNQSTTLGAVLLAKNLTTFKAYLDRYPDLESQIAAGNITGGYHTTSSEYKESILISCA